MALPENLEKGSIVDHEGAFVSQESLETGDAFSDSLRDFVEDLLGQVTDGNVETIVGNCLSSGLSLPCIESLFEGLPFALDGEIHYARRAPMSRCNGTRLKVIR